MLKKCFDSLMDEGTKAVLARCETLLDNVTVTIDSVGPMQAL